VLVGVNLGSGQRRFESTAEIMWMNVDHVSRPGQVPDLICDGRKMPIESGSVDYVVMSHCLEHFGCGEASDVIQEAYRVLKTGGSFIATVPDMRTLAVKWISGKLDDQLYFTNLYGAFMGEEADRHRWGFTSASLTNELEKHSPWRSISTFDWRSISGMDLARDWWILGKEAVK
jgi:ubiquinone/menaquinone biosynthesis C-methylase UbiE